MDNMIAVFLEVAVGLLVAYLAHVVNQMQKRREKEKEEDNIRNSAIMAGLQSLLRDKLIQGYNTYYKKDKWIPLYAKESLMAVADAYHNLGANGVMDDIIRDLRTLPTCPPKGEEDV